MRAYWVARRFVTGLEPGRGTAIAVLILVAAAMQWPLWGWEVEDSAISMAYARNFAAGDGLVPYVGAERVEGFSDPLWVACLAALNWVGFDPFSATRWLGLLFGCATVPAVFVALRPLEKEAPLAPVWGAAAVALFAPHAIWAQSGLENALFNFLLAVGCARLAIGGDREWLGPLAFLGLAWTRPEGVAYAAVAGALTIAAGQSPKRMATRAGWWFGVFVVPLLLSEGLRVWYFAQELPATFHAKLGNATFRPLDPRSRGWVQLRDFAADSWSVLLVPLVVVGVSGAREWRWITGIVASAILLMAWFTPTVPLLGLVLALPVLALGRKLPIGLAASLLLIALAFHIGTAGDWMRGYRWLSLTTVPGAMLVGVGIAELAERFEVMRIAAPVAAGLLAVPQAVFLAEIARKPEVDPRAVERRLQHWIEIGRRLHLDRRWQIVDHDMGGSLYFGGDVATFRDTRGLVDLPFALYGRERSVVLHELFEDRPFDFAHAHGSTQAAVRNLPLFRTGYVEVEGYGSADHRGQFVRRSLFLEDGWSGPSVPIVFAGGVQILGVSVPSPEVASGSGLYFEVAVASGKAPFRLIAFLSEAGRVLRSWDLPPAYDWVPPAAWRPGEVFHGKFSVQLPSELADGAYDLGFVVFDGKGEVLPALSASGPAQVPEQPRFAEGEARLSRVVTIVSTDEMGRLALVDSGQALAHAAAGRCEEAEASWTLALRHRTRARVWRDANRPPVARALARCLSNRAGSGPTGGDALLDRVHEIEAARLWDPREPAVWTNGARVAELAHDRAVRSDDATVRFRWFEAAVRADPRRSWDRRWAEKARGSWLGADRGPEEREPER